MTETPNKALGGALAIYEAYPRHVGKIDALRAIEKALKAIGDDPAWLQIGEQEPHAYLLDRVQLFAAAVTRWSQHDRQFIPHPATWFNRGSYADDPKEWERTAPEAKVNKPVMR